MQARLGISALAVALLTTACGGSSSGGSSGGSSATVTPKAPADTVTIGVAAGHLVDGSGRTLYLFEADKSTSSTCTGACAAAWPPETTTGTPTAAGKAKAALLGTTKRSDGSTQVTYHGHPLYRFSGDTSPGDMNGAGSDAFGAEWYPVTPAGDTLEDSGSGDSSPSPSSGGGTGYSYSY